MQSVAASLPDESRYLPIAQSMQSDAALSHQGAGVYQGEGEVMMAGRWDVTVQVSRAGQPLDSHVFTVVAR